MALWETLRRLGWPEGRLDGAVLGDELEKSMAR